MSINAQLPFFVCGNFFLDREYQRDIERYIYCEQFGVPPYEGDYGSQPAVWIEKAFTIKSALAQKQKKEVDNAKRNNHNKI